FEGPPVVLVKSLEQPWVVGSGAACGTTPPTDPSFLLHSPLESITENNTPPETSCSCGRFTAWPSARSRARVRTLLPTGLDPTRLALLVNKTSDTNPARTTGAIHSRFCQFIALPPLLSADPRPTYRTGVRRSPAAIVSDPFKTRQATVPKCNGK